MKNATHMGDETMGERQDQESSHITATSFKDKIVVALVTAVVTCFGSAIVVRYQLNKEHSIWQSEDIVFRERQIYDLKVALVERLTTLAAKYGGLRSHYDINLFFGTVALAVDDVGENDMAHFMTERSNRGEKIYTERVEVFGELQSQLLLTKMLFGQDVQAAADELIRHFDEGEGLPISSNELYSKVLEAYEKGMNRREVVDSLAKSFVNNARYDEYKKWVRALLSAMVKELRQTSES